MRPIDISFETGSSTVHSTAKTAMLGTVVIGESTGFFGLSLHRRQPPTVLVEDVFITPLVEMLRIPIVIH